MVIDCKNCKYYDYDLFEFEDSKIKPIYYGDDIDVIEFCQRNNLSFMQGNVIKYVTRYKNKNGIEDLEKAKEYIERLIEFERRENK